jgi:predicted DNA-binding transcriptional regulator YafY
MREEWHPKQKSEVLPDGSYVLQVPYSDDRELAMEILKYGPEVEVLEPDTLRARIAERLADALKIYI